MCLHEIALHNGYPDDFRPPFRLRAPSNISCTFPDVGTARLDSVITSLTSAHSLLDVLLQRPARSLRVLPTFLYIRVIYCVFILLKIFFTCSAPGSELGKVLHPDAIKVEHYLSCLVSHIQDAISDENCRLAAKFCAVFVKFRTWFRNQVLRMHNTSGAVDEELFEPLRLLTLHDEGEAPRAPQQTNAPSVHENPLAHVRGTCPDATASKGAFYGNLSHWPKPEAPDHVGGSSMPSNIGTWQHPMPWGDRLPNSDPGQPAEKSESGTSITEPQVGALPVDCSTQAPLDNTNNVMDDPLDLAMEFDFDSHLWDFEMVDIIFEQT
jgi:RalA-binding protein 1